MQSNRRHSEGTDGLPKLYQIFHCEVATIQAYGIFVKIPGYRKNGLVHKSQMATAKVDDPSDMVEPREKVYCKVISIDMETEKIGMSMKVVNQTTGQDMDPGHVQTSLDEQRRKTGHVKEIPRIELGAVLDTTCKKCGGKGHLANDCFHVPGSKTYDLLPGLDYMAEQEQGEAEQRQAVKAAKKQAKKLKKEKKKIRKQMKKEKKKKKKKMKRRRDSSSSDSDSSSDEPSRKRKHKLKKKRNVSSEESSDSSEDSSDSSTGQKSPKKHRRSTEYEGRYESHLHGHHRNDTSHASHRKTSESHHRDKSMDERNTSERYDRQGGSSRRDFHKEEREHSRRDFRDQKRDSQKDSREHKRGDYSRTRDRSRSIDRDRNKRY